MKRWKREKTTSGLQTNAFDSQREPDEGYDGDADAEAEQPEREDVKRLRQPEGGTEGRTKPGRHRGELGEGGVKDADCTSASEAKLEESVE